MMVMDLYRF